MSDPLFPDKIKMPSKNTYEEGKDIGYAIGDGTYCMMEHIVQATIEVKRAIANACMSYTYNVKIHNSHELAKALDILKQAYFSNIKYAHPDKRKEPSFFESEYVTDKGST